MSSNSTIKNVWKVWLQDNPLTTDVSNDYIAKVSTVKDTLRNEQIAQLIVDEGSEIKFDTLLSVLNQRDRIVRQALCDGSSVMDGNCQMTPRILGTWLGSTATFDPRKHKRTVDIVPTLTLRKALEEVGVEVLGARQMPASIGLVTDTNTGLTNGAVTKGDDIDLDGKKIKVLGDDENVGVFFVNTETGERTKVSRRLTQNTPGRIIARVPDTLKNGTYRLEVVTQFSNSGGQLLKSPRTIQYDQLLYVGVTPPTGGGTGGTEPPSGGSSGETPLG